MHVVVSVSGGAGSTLAAHRAADKFGLDNVTLVFADTNTEHESLYALLDHMETLLKPIVRLNDGRDIWDVFDEHGIIRTPTGSCKASLELKIKPIADYVASNFSPEDSIIVSGLEYTEPERRKRFDNRWAPFKCWHPLADAPILSNCQIVDKIKEMGYPEQTLYERRFPHNNCGGGCILAGLGQWHGLYLDDKKTFDYHKLREKQFNEKNRKDKEPFAVLRDQSAKPVVKDGEIIHERKVTPLTLEEFEQRILSNTISTRDFRSVCGCVLGEQTNFFDLLDKAA